MDNTDKILSLTDSSSEHGIKIIQPSINNSEYSFVSLSDTEIIFGLGAIKGVGYNAAEHIIQERSKNGNYKNIPDISKWILTVGMILGRLELFATIIVLFIPSFWRRY